MAEKEGKNSTEKLSKALLSIASMFETGRVKSMRDITSLHPTALVKALGINYGGFMSKCSAPEKFVVSDIIKLSNLLNIDSESIMKIVLREAQENFDKKNIIVSDKKSNDK